MSVAYVDASTIVAIAFGEESGIPMGERLDGFSMALSANLLEAELRAEIHRVGDCFEPALIAGIHWILPDRPLGPEIETVLAAGYLTGADLWHVAVALSVVDEPSEITFLTLDDRQRTVAEELGFNT